MILSDVLYVFWHSNINAFGTCIKGFFVVNQCYGHIFLPCSFFFFFSSCGCTEIYIVDYLFLLFLCCTISVHSEIVHFLQSSARHAGLCWRSKDEKLTYVSTNLHTSTLCGRCVRRRCPAKSDSWWRRIAKESQENPCTIITPYEFILAVARTLLSILAPLNNVVIWMALTRPPISNSSSPLTKLFGIVPSAPITIGIIIYSLRIFHIIFCWWSFTGVWVTASLLKSPGLFSVFWPFSIML